MSMKRILFTLVLMACTYLANCQEIPKWKITDVEKLMASGNGDILIINFWATFCKPCVAEIPSFIKIADKYKDDHVKLTLVSLDLPSYYPARIRSFAKKHRFNSNITWLNETNADYFCPKIDTTWSGSIPATLIVNTKTGFRKFFEGEIEADTLEQEIKNAIGK